jgi:hypothetical protein
MVEICENVLTSAEDLSQDSATCRDLVSLDEIKIAFGVDPSDTSQDANLAMMITHFSDVVATTCNRVFAYEEVEEIWECLGSRRIYPSHWPIKKDDIESIECPQGLPLDPSMWRLEPRSGKVQLLGSRSEPIYIKYKGGFNLPDEAPPALKEATTLLIRENQMLALRFDTAGVRSISHKESRIMFFDPLSFLKKTEGFGWATTAANELLMHYTRLVC